MPPPPIRVFLSTTWPFILVLLLIHNKNHVIVLLIYFVYDNHLHVHFFDDDNTAETRYQFTRVRSVPVS